LLGRRNRDFSGGRKLVVFKRRTAQFFSGLVGIGGHGVSPENAMGCRLERQATAHQGGFIVGLGNTPTCAKNVRRKVPQFLLLRKAHSERHGFSPDDPSELNRLEIRLGNATVWASPVLGDVGPQGAGGDAILWAPCGLVVHKAADDTDEGFEIAVAHGVSLF
jgi:hypothetical protein